MTIWALGLSKALRAYNWRFRSLPSHSCLVLTSRWLPFIFDCIFFSFLQTNWDMASCSCFIEFSLTSRTFLIRRVFISLSCCWIYSSWVFICWFWGTNRLSKLKRHHLPLRQLCSSSWNRLILSSFGILALCFRNLLLVLFLCFLKKFYLIVVNNALFFHVVCLPLLDKNVFAYLNMLLIGILVKLTTATWAFF